MNKMFCYLSYLEYIFTNIILVMARIEPAIYWGMSPTGKTITSLLFMVLKGIFELIFLH